jgi:hypothetical protein
MIARQRFSSLVCVLLLAPAAVLADATVTFDGGAQGWSGPGGPGGSTVIEPAGGNPGANMHTVFNNFGISFVNSTNPDFVFDYTTTPFVTLSIDIRVHSIEFFGSPVTRPWLVELRDFDNPPPGYPYVSVWYKFADISSAQHGNWTTFQVTIDDTSAEDLPPGWGGTGAETPQAEPILPPNRTFASVLAGVDQIAYTTLEPGFVFGFTDFDMRLDNIGIQVAGPPVPAASTWGLAAMAGLLVLAGAALVRRRGAYRSDATTSRTP